MIINAALINEISPLPPKKKYSTKLNESIFFLAKNVNTHYYVTITTNQIDFASWILIMEGTYLLQMESIREIKSTYTWFLNYLKKEYDKLDGFK